MVTAVAHVSDGDGLAYDGSSGPGESQWDSGCNTKWSKPTLLRECVSGV